MAFSERAVSFLGVWILLQATVRTGDIKGRIRASCRVGVKVGETDGLIHDYIQQALLGIFKKYLRHTVGN